MTIKLQKIIAICEEIAPIKLAEDWDNVGLLIGNTDSLIRNVMTCLTITPEVIDEAISRQVELIISHHPLPFKAIKTITSKSNDGRMLLKLIENKIAVYSSHTAFDSAEDGINEQIARGITLEKTSFLQPISETTLGCGRFGYLKESVPLRDLINTVKQFFSLDHLQFVGSSERMVKKIAIACGAAGSMLANAIKLNCDVFLTGECNFHTALLAKACSINLLLCGHYASERFAMEQLANKLNQLLPEITVFASSQDTEPYAWL